MFGRNFPFIRPRSNLMEQRQIAVTQVGELVHLRFGNVEIDLHYNDALLVSQWIRVRAKGAKIFAGDSSRHWSTVGILHDANYGPGKTRG